MAGMTTGLMKCCEKYWEWYHCTAPLKSEVWYQYRTGAVILPLKCFSLKIKRQTRVPFQFNLFQFNTIEFVFLFFFYNFFPFFLHL